MPRPAGECHLDALIEKYARGRTVTEIERDAGLREGALGHHLKPSQRGRMPRVHILERFVEALGAPMWEVSSAFAADAGLGMEESPLSPRARRLVEKYSKLDTAQQDLIDGIVDLIARQQDEAPSDETRVTQRDRPTR